MKGRFPISVIFLKLPFDQVDVNVHPAKQEVKFANSRKVYETVSGAVLKALERPDAPVARPALKRPALKPVPERVSELPGAFGRIEKDPTIPGETDPEASRVNRLEHGANKMERLADESVRRRERPRPPFLPRNLPETRGFPKKIQARPHVPPKRFKPHKQRELWEKKHFSDMRIIGQFRQTYILCESADGLVLVDQHAAHERVLFEELKKNSKKTRPAAQKLLVTETIETGYREGKLLEEIMPDLSALGFELEPFGGNSFAIKSVPALLVKNDIKLIIMEIIEKMAGIGFAPGLEKAIDECLILMACHSAIRANQKLPEEQMKNLLKQLDECETPSHCPHGRPVLIAWPAKTIEKSFKRTG